MLQLLLASIALKRNITIFNYVSILSSCIFCQWQISTFLSNKPANGGGGGHIAKVTCLLAMGHTAAMGRILQRAQWRINIMQIDIIYHYITTFPVWIILTGFVNWGHYWIPHCLRQTILKNFLYPHLFKCISHTLYWVCPSHYATKFFFHLSWKNISNKLDVT